MQCLLIDDNPIDLLINQHVVRSVISDAEVVQKTSGSEALAFLRKNRGKLPDLIFLDIKMPEMDGFQFLEKLKVEIQEHKNLRVYMVSSSIDPEDIRRAADDEMVLDFIHKPLNEDSLKRCLASN